MMVIYLPSALRRIRNYVLPVTGKRVSLFDFDWNPTVKFHRDAMQMSVVPSFASYESTTFWSKTFICSDSFYNNSNSSYRYLDSYYHNLTSYYHRMSRDCDNMSPYRRNMTPYYNYMNSFCLDMNRNYDEMNSFCLNLSRDDDNMSPFQHNMTQHTFKMNRKMNFSKKHSPSGAN